MHGRIKDETGKKYGRLTVIEYTGSKHGCATWRCKCDCGNEIVTRGNFLRSGDSVSCGCWRVEQLLEKTTLPEGMAAFNRVYGNYKRHAEERGLSFELTKEDFSFLTKMNCHYCGAEPSNESPAHDCNGSYTYNGIDRIDNSRGYTLDNVVPCCAVCNSMKGKLEYREFFEHIRKILNRR